MFKGLGNLAGMIKQAQEMSGKMQAMADELRLLRASGSAGAGMVEVDVNGVSEVLACRIDPSLLEQNDRELLEDLIVGAVNQALTKAKQLHADAIKNLAGGMEVPGLDEALAKYSGNS